MDALIAPITNIDLFFALCENSISSLSLIKLTLCSPEISPALTTENPISPIFLFSFNEVLSKTFLSSSISPRPLATSLPKAKAVPDGASTLYLWCLSKISVSYSFDFKTFEIF